MDPDEKKAYEEGLAAGRAKVKAAKLKAAKAKGEADAEKPTLGQSLLSGAKRLLKEAKANS